MRFKATLVAALLTLPSVLSAQRCPGAETTRCFLPLDLGQGFALDAGEPTPYRFTARLSPGIGVAGEGGSVRVGPAVAVTYLNPEWEVGVGAQASLRLLPFGAPHWGLFAHGEQLLWTSEDRMPGALALVANAGAIRVGGWFIHDWEGGGDALELTIGTDLQVLIPLLFPKGDEDPFGGAAASSLRTREVVR